jgi:hypothetical protein
MRVICCFSDDVHPKCAEAIGNFAPQTEYVKTEGLYGYNEVIGSRWTGKSDLVVIEADKEITAEVIPSFGKCEHRWCVYSYMNLPAPFTKEVQIGLGCSRFSAEAQRIVSVDEFLCEDVFWQPCMFCDGKGCWNQLDSRMARALKNHGITQHVHGMVEHHHVFDDAWWKTWHKQVDFRMEKVNIDRRYYDVGEN